MSKNTHQTVSLLHQLDFALLPSREAHWASQTADIERDYLAFLHDCRSDFESLESALDPEHPYYDAKSTSDNPKWCKVRVAYRRKFPELIKLKELQKYAKEGGILQNLQTLRQSRLSVSKVSKKEWDFILSLAGDEEEDEEEADDVEASALQLNTLGAGEGGADDADSTLTAVWTGTNGTNGTSNQGNNDTGDP